MIDVKKFKDAFKKDRLPKVNIDLHKIKSGLKRFMDGIKNFSVSFCEGFMKLIKSLYSGIMTLIKSLNKENLKILLGSIKKLFSKENFAYAYGKVKAGVSKTIRVFSKENIKGLYTKLRQGLTKEKLKERYDSIKDAFTRENLITKWEELKANLKDNAKVYIVFSAIAAICITGLTVEIVQHNKQIPVSKKYVITDNQAEEFYYAGEYDKAIEEYRKIQEKDMSEGLWDAKIAEIYSAKGEIENSKNAIAVAREQGSKNPEVLNYTLFTEFMNKDYKAAMEHGEEYIQLFPKDKRLVKTMFTVYMANNELEKAKNLVSNYPLDVKSAFDTAEYARMLMIVGQWEEGYKELRSAWNLDKDEYKIFDVLAQIAVYNKDLILENVTSLSNKNPNDLAYKMWLAKIYSLSDLTAPQAGKLLEELKSEEVGKIEIKLIEASILQNTNQGDKADELLKEVIEENKDDYRVLHTAGWYYLNKKDLLNAEKYCRESIIKNKNYTDNYGFLMPEILKAQGKGLEGEPYFRSAMYKEPYNYNIMLTIANYYWYTTKNSDKALEYFKFAEIVKPEDAEIKYNMALINLTNNKIDEAVNLLGQCIKLSDSTPKYHRTLGTIYLLNKKPAEAIKEIRYAYATDQDDIMTLNNAGAYYITEDQNLEKGEYNLRKAQEGINPSTDQYTADTIRSNYQKVKELLDKYNNGRGNESLRIPELTLFY